MACTSCNDSSANKSKSTKSFTSSGSGKNVFKSGMNLLIQAKKIWQQTEQTPPIEPTQPEQNNDTNV